MDSLAHVFFEALGMICLLIRFSPVSLETLIVDGGVAEVIPDMPQVDSETVHNDR